MRHLILYSVLVFAFASGVAAQNSAAEVEAIIKLHCENEWPSDYEMRAYCERQQRSAVRELAQLANTNGGIPKTAFETALGGCIREWPEDYQMLAYCLKQQIEGYHNVERGPATYGVNPTSEELNTIRSHCQSEWPNDFQMRSYCEKQQIEGLRFIKSRSSSVSANTWGRTVSQCGKEWRRDYQMQAYCVRQKLGW